MKRPAVIIALGVMAAPVALFATMVLWMIVESWKISGSVEPFCDGKLSGGCFRPAGYVSGASAVVWGASTLLLVILWWSGWQWLRVSGPSGQRAPIVLALVFIAAAALSSAQIASNFSWM